MSAFLWLCDFTLNPAGTEQWREYVNTCMASCWLDALDVHFWNLQKLQYITGHFSQQYWTYISWSGSLLDCMYVCMRLTCATHWADVLRNSAQGRMWRAIHCVLYLGCMYSVTMVTMYTFRTFCMGRTEFSPLAKSDSNSSSSGSPKLCRETTTDTVGSSHMVTIRIHTPHADGVRVVCAVHESHTFTQHTQDASGMESYVRERHTWVRWYVVQSPVKGWALSHVWAPPTQMVQADHSPWQFLPNILNVYRALPTSTHPPTHTRTPFIERPGCTHSQLNTGVITKCCSELNYSIMLPAVCGYMAEVSYRGSCHQCTLTASECLSG